MDNGIVNIISETQTGTVLFAILILLLSALICGEVVTKLKCPRVAGEIIGGIIVGPSIMGNLFPTTYNKIFFNFDGQNGILSIFYWLGLIFLMFSTGFESNFEDINEDQKIIGWLVAGSTVLPLAIGFFLSKYMFVDQYIGAAHNRFVFSIVFALATAVTSLPVISKIFIDLGIIKHRYAKIVLATATVHDLILWVILSVASSLVLNDTLVISDLIFHIGITLFLFFVAMFVTSRLNRFKFWDNIKFNHFDSFYFIICFFFVFICSLLGINIMYSAFISGMIFKGIRKPESIQAHNKVKDICLAFFTPIYFAIVGLRIHLTNDFSVFYFVSFLVLASLIQLVSCIIAMKLIKLDWNTSINLGVAMNARGGPGIVLATVAYDLKIINYEFFCILILVVLITSTVAGYWINFANKKGKLLTIS